MKKNILFIIIATLTTLKISAQTTTAESLKGKAYKIVFQLTSNDTLVQKAMVQQIKNVLTASPKTKIEVVCHSNGITFLQTNITQQTSQVKELTARGVVFAACENTIRERKIDKKDILREAVFVPVGALEVTDKELSGWAYLKAGF